MVICNQEVAYEHGARWATAFRMNEQGWAEQLTRIARYVAA